MKILKQNIKNRIYRARCRGSLTLEAALVLPIFIFAILAMLSFMEIIRANADIEKDLHKAVRQETLYASCKDISVGADGVGDVGSDIISTVLADGYALKVLRDEYTASNGQSVGVLRGGPDITDLVLSRVDTDAGIIDICILYDAYPYCSFLGLNTQKLANRCYAHIWTGYTGKESYDGEGETGEEMVYITETGTVYHRSRSCTYLDRNISTYSGSSNRNGENYRACDVCNPESSEGCYVTDYGDCYHSSLTCPALKRTIREVPLSSVCGMPACSKCGETR